METGINAPLGDSAGPWGVRPLRVPTPQRERGRLSALLPAAEPESRFHPPKLCSSPENESRHCARSRRSRASSRGNGGPTAPAPRLLRARPPAALGSPGTCKALRPQPAAPPPLSPPPGALSPASVGRAAPALGPCSPGAPSSGAFGAHDEPRHPVGLRLPPQVTAPAPGTVTLPRMQGQGPAWA